MKKIAWSIAYILSFILAVSTAGYIGVTKSLGLILGPVPSALTTALIPRPAPSYDPTKPTVAILLGNTPTEPTDFLGPYAMFAESGAYNVYAVASSRAVRTLAGGLDVVPQLSFAELAAQLGRKPDIVVVPAMADVESSENVPVVDWLRQQWHGHTLLFSWCEGAEVLAASGLIDGKTVTTHWASIDRYERTYPGVHWQRGERYIDSGTLLTTGGLTSGIDATLHLLERRNGASIAAKVAQALHIPASPFVSNPHMQQYSLEASDGVFLLNFGFGWPKRRSGVWLYDGIGEFDLAAAIDVYQATNQIYTVADAQSVVSRRGLQFVPRGDVHTLPNMDRMLVPGGNGATREAKLLQARFGRANVPVTLLQDDAAPAFAFQITLEDLAREHDIPTAAFGAKRLEVRSPVSLDGSRWPLRQLLVLLLAGLTGSLALGGGARFSRAFRSIRQFR